MSHPRARHVTDLAAPPDGRLLFAPGPATAAYRWDGEVLCRLDARLSTAGAVPWDVSPGERLLAALPVLSRAVFGSGAGLRITGPGRTGRVVSVRHADSATFVARNRLLVSAPIMYLPDGRGREERGWHRVHLVDTEAARVVDRQLLGDSVDAGVDALAHPHDGTVLLTAFEGQDGGKVFAVRVDADRMTVRRIADDLIPVDFSPRGDRLLCIGYHGGPVVMLRWPDLTVVSTLHRLDTGDETPDDDSCFAPYGCLVADRRAVLLVNGPGVVSWFPDSGETARVTFPEPWTDVSHETLHGLGGGRFATTAWARTGTVAVWRLPGRPPERPLTVHKAWQ